MKSHNIAHPWSLPLIVSSVYTDTILSSCQHGLQDLRQAKLLVIGDSFEALGRTHRSFAALMGCVVLSASILNGEGGLKMSFRPGFEKNVRVFLTGAFKNEAPALTQVIRQVCSLGKGWRAVTRDEAVTKNGWKWGLVLHGKQEPVPAPRSKCKFLRWLTADEFVSWATKEFVDETHSAWVKGP